MPARQVRDGIFWVGSIDWDRRLFDALIPTPEGTSYNSYFIFDEKNVLIDTVDPGKKEELFSNLDQLGVNHIDYLIVNHAEQDHSGSIPFVLKRFSEIKIVTNKKCAEMLKDMYLLPDDRFIIIEDGEELSIGQRTLKFILAPWVHWPETMLTYVHNEKILFTCDLFGSHLATSDLYVEDEGRVYSEAKRYYAEIMMPFRQNIKGHMAKIKELELDLIAPSHGPIYGTPSFILNAYDDWISDETKNEVVIAYVSMHNTTKAMAEHLTKRLMERHVGVRLYNLVNVDLGELAMGLVDARTIILATPTVFTGPHPKAAYAAMIINELRPKCKYVGVIGSYSWGEQMINNIKKLLNHMQVEFLNTVIAKKHNSEEEFWPLDGLADEIARLHHN